MKQGYGIESGSKQVVRPSKFNKATCELDMSRGLKDDKRASLEICGSKGGSIVIAPRLVDEPPMMRKERYQVPEKIRSSRD